MTRPALVLCATTVLGIAVILVHGGGACGEWPCGHVLLGAADAWRSPVLDAVFRTVTWGGSMFVLAPLAALWTARELRRGGGRAAWFVPLALVSTWAGVHVVKWLVARPRPALFQPLIDMPLDASFPSAHAAQAAAMATAWLVRPGASCTGTCAVALALAVFAVGSSRVYLQVHYPSDVAAGWVLGAVWVRGLRAAPLWRQAGR